VAERSHVRYTILFMAFVASAVNDAARATLFIARTALFKESGLSKAAVGRVPGAGA